MPADRDGPIRRRATLVDVAQLAKVSPSAVSRTFKSGGSVSKKTRQRVLKAAAEIGFQPNALARSLMTGRTALIALVTNAFANPFINIVVDVFTTELQSRNLRPLAFNLKGDFDWSDTINLMLQYQIDGVVIASSTLDQTFIDRVVDARFPTVQAFGRYSGDRLMDSVFVNNVEGGRIAASELVARGYRSPGFIGVSDSVSTSLDRLSGFQEVLQDAGILPPIVQVEGYSHRCGREGAARLLATHPDLDSLFCADDLLALGALDALHFDLGREPGEVGVIGFNDIDAAGWPSHALSTFRSHTGQIVVNAIDMLETRIVERERPGEQRIVSCRFIERGTVRSRLDEEDTGG